jgi:hypothetical protein
MLPSVVMETASRFLKRFAEGNEVQVPDGKFLLPKPEFFRKDDIM